MNLHITSRQYLLVAVIVLVFSVGAHARTELSADEIVERANQVSYYAGDDGRADVHMQIKSGDGVTRERKFTLLRKNEGEGKQKFYAYFRAPADVNQMAYLVWKNPDGDDDRWLWLPALNLKKRIAPGDKRTSFVGSDFLYEDVSGRSPALDEHVLLESSDSAYVIENTPKDPAAVEFSRYVVHIDAETFLPTKALYYDHSDNLYRRVSAESVETIQGIPTVMESKAEDLQRKSVTTNTFSNVEYNIGLSSRIFTERFLRRPPREVMK
ncbi:MAG: outer membrane lipoprotein-sorting protein [Geobacteraceae bacterium]|nr:outer membrane lipoprotein-sorting protein [Geobacteraceae bacterium]